MLKCRQVSVALVLAVLTMPLAPLPALAQQDVVKRVDKLEAEMKAVQRQVFPGGASKYFQPEYSDTQPAAPQQQGAGADLLTELQGRITSLEQQNANLTGQVEEASFRARQAEEALNRFREDVEYRLTVLEGGDPTALKAGAAGAAGAAAGGALGGTGSSGSGVRAPAASGTGAAQPFPPPGFDPKGSGVSSNATDPATTAAAAAGASSLSADDQYKAAYAFVNQNDYPRAEAALGTFIERNPKHARTADAMYWLARVQLVQKKHALAAKGFLDTYQKYPKATRAPDSLLGLGDALAGLGSLKEACQAYDQLEIDYPAAASGNLKTRLSQGRSKAKCG